MEFRILGPLEVVEDGRSLPLGGGRQRALLALLLTRPNEVVSTDRLVDQLWARPPKTALNTLQFYVSQLRKLLGTDRIVTRPPGYEIVVGPGELDLERFEVLLARDDAGALREALALWRGPALADLAFEPFAQAESGRLEELRLAALERRVDLDLEDGRASELVGELEALVAEHPLRERLQAQLMLALYRSGRQAEALGAYQASRRALVEQLGIEPGPALQELERAILRQDAGLDPAQPAMLERSPQSRPVEESSERRKVVTCVFCDVSGSTAFGDSVDPEVLRGLLARYFERMKAVVERHGGVVEKFIGDAVMAVFGLPAAHEDDALRALRAAVEMRAALPELGIDARIGVNTGEVVTGTEERLVTGDAVNVAARLEQAAAPGEILVGEATLRLARDAVEAEPIEALALKGKSAKVQAWRLLSVLPETASRRTDDSSLVGREDELRSLSEGWERVRADGGCELATVIGAAGVGKSRLVAEFLARAGGTVIRGRCLSYGDGITYWPVVEALKQLEPRLSELELDPTARAVIEDLLANEGAASTDEIAWAFRKLLEATAAREPLVTVFDDIQWGEEAFLDLIEHIAYLSTESPILLLCMSRPELLDRRPGWGGLLRVEPLTPDDAGRLIDARLGGRELEPKTREQMLHASGGNPLFVEELAAMMKESDSEEISIPPTLQALLATRLDQLDPAERTVLERAAVEGEIFHRGGVQALAPGETRLTTRLTSLVRKELVRTEQAQLAGEDAYRFRHLLIRDAAYEALPKSTRAELHGRLAAWLEQHATDLTEPDEIIGHHLEQAYRYLAELGELDDLGRALARDAGKRLETAGRRALTRGDVGAAIALLERSWSLVDQDEVEVGLGLALADALFDGGRPTEAVELAGVIAVRAAAIGDRTGELRARLDAARLGMSVDRSIAAEGVLALAADARPALEESGDHAALAAAAMAVLSANITLLQFEAVVVAAREAVGHAQEIGDRRLEQSAQGWLDMALLEGPMPAEEVLRAYDQKPSLDEVVPFRRTFRAVCLAMLGHLDEARELAADDRRRMEEFDATTSVASTSQGRRLIEVLAGDLEAAEREIREGCDLLESMGESSFLSTFAAELAQILCSLDRLEEATEWARRSRALGPEDDIATQSLWRQAAARVAARNGQIEEAERLAREAVALVAPTDSLHARADAQASLAEVLQLTGRSADASKETEIALVLYERKGDVVSAGKARELLAVRRVN